MSSDQEVEAAGGNKRQDTKKSRDALVFTAFVGVVTYGLTVWLAPASGVPIVVAIIVATITGLAIISPSEFLRKDGGDRNPFRPPETWYDFDFSLDKHNGQTLPSDDWRD